MMFLQRRWLSSVGISLRESTFNSQMIALTVKRFFKVFLFLASIGLWPNLRQLKALTSSAARTLGIFIV
jgi:hypothetical protein